MSGTTWLVDGRRIATKIRSASDECDPKAVSWKSNPTRTCPRCNHIIDNSDVSQEWPGLPKGVKFDPTDQELLWHLLAKVGIGDAIPHPFIDEFIQTLEGVEGICYTHPKKLPGVKQDGSISHFFHQTFKAYSTGTRKRRKINNDSLGDVRWHKTGKTKPVIIDGEQQGCKKIMVLYMSTSKGGKPEKTNWVMHQYHLGTGEDEKDGEFVVSKVFYQQQTKQNERSEVDAAVEIEIPDNIVENDPPANSKLATPEPPEKRIHSADLQMSNQATEMHDPETKDEGTIDNEANLNHDYNRSSQDPKWWEGESQYLLDTQQLAEGIALCEEFLQSQASCGGSNEEERLEKVSLSDYALIGAESFKKDLEDCQKLTVMDHPDLTFDTPDIRLSQLEFESQDSFLAWGGEKLQKSPTNP